MLYLWREQQGILYYELKNPSETAVNVQRYQQQLLNLNYVIIEKRPQLVRLLSQNMSE